VSRANLESVTSTRSFRIRLGPGYVQANLRKISGWNLPLVRKNCRWLTSEQIKYFKRHSDQPSGFSRKQKTTPYIPIKYKTYPVQLK